MTFDAGTGSKAAAIRLAPWLIATLSIFLMLAGAGLGLVYMVRTGSPNPLLSHTGVVQASTFFYAGVGALIVSRKPKNTIGWLFLVIGLLSGIRTVTDNFTLFSGLEPATPPIWKDGAVWTTRWIYIPLGVLPSIFVFLLFPTGRPLSRRWALIGWITGLSLIAAVLCLALYPGTIPKYGTNRINPFGITDAGPYLDPVLDASLLAMTICGVGSILALVLRYRRSRGIERDQMKWLILAGGVVFMGAALAAAAPILQSLLGVDVKELGFIIGGLGDNGIAAAVGIAILRHQLFDIDLVINRTLVYGALTAAVIAVYLFVVGGLGLLLQAQNSLGVSLFGVAAVALAVQPARDRLQRAVNHLMYGERNNPYAALSRLSRRLENTIAPEAVLPSIVETVAQTLRVPYAAIALEIWREAGNPPVVVSHGEPVPNPLTLPLIYQSETIGTLFVGPGPGEAFSPADLRLLSDLARQAGVAVHAVRLTAELQESRRKLVTAREEERRRLRRDLHDGLGSQLAALHLRIDTLRTLIPDGADPARALASELRDEVHAAIGDIRRLVYELRPPALDELGLAGALRALAAHSSSTENVQVNVDAPESLPHLQAAIEVAAYRIAQEALTNVLKHAGARNCEIRLAFEQELRLVITDDGRGLPDELEVGVGLRSMRERAAELGGRFKAANRAGGGVRITVTLPLSPILAAENDRRLSDVVVKRS